MKRCSQFAASSDSLVVELHDEQREKEFQRVDPVVQIAYL